MAQCSVRLVCTAVVCVAMFTGCTAAESGGQDAWGVGADDGSSMERGDAGTDGFTPDGGGDDDAREGDDGGSDGGTVADADDSKSDGVDVRSFCEGVREVVEVGDTVSGRLERGNGEIDEAACSSAEGREHEYALWVPNETDVRIRTTYEGENATEFSPVLTLFRDCGGDKPVACSDPLRGFPGDANGYIQMRLEAGTYRLRVDERGDSGGSYTIQTETLELPQNATCENARQIAPEQRKLRVGPSELAAISDYSSCVHQRTATRYFTTTAPAGHVVEIRTNYPDEENADPRVAVGTSCDGDTCSPKFDGGDDGAVSYSNRSDQRRQLYVAVADSLDEPYTVEVETRAMVDHASCQAARRLEPGGEAETLDFSRAWANGETCKGFTENTLFYEVEVPPGHRLLNDVRSESDAGASLDYKNACGADACLEAGPRRPFVNRSDQPRELVLEANSESSETFELSTQTFELSDHARCESPPSVGVGERLSDQDPRRAANAYNPCSHVFLANTYYTSFYRVEAPGDASVEVHAESNNSDNFALSLQAFDAEDPNLCGGDEPAECRAESDWYNRRSPEAQVTLGGAGSPDTYVVAVLMSPTFRDQPPSTFDVWVEQP